MKKLSELEFVEDKFLFFYEFLGLRQGLANSKTLDNIKSLLNSKILFPKQKETGQITNLQRKCVQILNLIKGGKIRSDNTLVSTVERCLNTLVSRNKFPVLKACLADMYLRALEIKEEKELGWRDAQGYKIHGFNHIVGILWPVRPGREIQRRRPDVPVLHWASFGFGKRLYQFPKGSCPLVSFGQPYPWVAR